MTTRRDFLKTVGCLPLAATLTKAAEEISHEAGSGSCLNLRAVCEQGLRERYRNQPSRCSNGTLTRPVQERLDHELQVIHELNLDEYFLVLQDLVQYAQNQDSLVATLGTAVGSLVSFALGLSPVCPLRHRLLFERFLVPGRQSAPTVSIMVGQESQEEIVRYARSKYGQVDQESFPFRAFGQKWQTNDTETLTIDVLRVRDLSILGKTFRLIQMSGEPTADISKLPENDPETLALFQRGDTEDIFQFKSNGIRSFLKKLQPERFEDLAAASALYRPSTLRSGLSDDYVAARKQRQRAYPNTDLEEILLETRGFLIYDEQVMEIVHRLAGMDYGEGYQLIRAIWKRKQEVIDEYRARFLAAAGERGVQQQVADETFRIITRSGIDALYKGRVIVIAHLAYQLGYLKSHFPTEFAACEAVAKMQKPVNPQ